VVAFVERDPAVSVMLLAGMEEADGLEPAPVWCGDLADLDAEAFAGVDFITAGFPCQPWSMAGKRKGTEDERWIWGDIARIIRVVGPRFLLLENVPGLLVSGLGHVLGTLASLGYRYAWDVFAASQVGASHKRERLFIVAHREGRGFDRVGVPAGPGEEGAGAPDPGRGGADVADAGGVGAGGPQQEHFPWGGGAAAPDERGAGLADADERHAGRRGARDRGAGPADEGGDVGDADRADGRGRGAAGRAADAAVQPGEAVADADGAGLEEGRRVRLPRPHPSAFPPGPADWDAWEWIIANRRELAPSVGDAYGRGEGRGPAEREVGGGPEPDAAGGGGGQEEAEHILRGVADGVAGRTDQLRACGNSVVPVVAAAAWRTLAARLGGMT